MPGSATAVRQERLKKASVRPNTPVLFTINEEDEQQKNNHPKRSKGTVLFIQGECVCSSAWAYVLLDVLHNVHSGYGRPVLSGSRSSCTLPVFLCCKL